MIMIDFRDKRPIYEQIVEKFQHLIIQGAMEADSKMPSVRNLAIELSINPNTIQKAYGELERQGYIYAVKGKGNFVCCNEELKKKEKEKAMDDLFLQINRCKDMGISLDEVHHLAATLYEEESYD